MIPISYLGMHLIKEHCFLIVAKIFYTNILLEGTFHQLLNKKIQCHHFLNCSVNFIYEEFLVFNWYFNNNNNGLNTETITLGFPNF